MKNDYWSKRLANEYWNIYNDTSKYQKELIELYKKANEEILAELYKITAKFEENGVVSRSEFYKAEHLKRMEKGFNDVLRELGEKVEYKGSKIILNAGKDVVLSTGESLGIDINYNEDLAKKLLQTNWKGSNFSKRVWKNSKKLEKELNTQVKKGILMGKPTAQIAIELDKSMGVGLTNTARLVRTETMHHMNDVNLQNMKANGVKQVEEVVTLDERTSSTCKVHNKKIHDIEKAPILPRHPNCRCVLVPYVDVEKLTQEFDRREKEIFERIKNNSENSVGNMNDIGYNIYKKGFRTYDDPIREVLGSMFDSNPRETKELLKTLNDIGVEVKISDRRDMFYSGSPRIGKPGQLIIDENASFSALLHEYTHAIDDMNNGWDGIVRAFDPDKLWEMEEHAYDVEITFCKEKGIDNKVIERLIELKEKRRKEIFNV